MTDDLKERVDQFNTLRLPGQGWLIHMGTSRLINDLWREIERLRQENQDLLEDIRWERGGKDDR